jgi:GTP cyclohydrolase I
VNRANDTIYKHLLGKDRAAMERSVQRAFESVLDAMLIEWRDDHNTKDTPRRLARMYLREVFAGRYTPPPRMTSFPNARQMDEVYVVGPVTVRSTCAHHFAPIVGQAWIGVLPSKKIIGLSKFARLTAWVMARPQIQEEATIMLADELEERLKPHALAVVVRASHLCMTWRGVKEHKANLTTSVMRGWFRSDPALRAEVLSLIRSSEGA